ncbi:fidgetin-like protein 1 [Ptychodera flava]|uniref:fidgetin-like protein 1 n=1 Tax=Ptychodera flava TaxID=63121 RepID=UPI00396A0F8A
MASVEESDSIDSLLNQWQRHYFVLKTEGSTAAQKADAIRGILSQVQYASATDRLPDKKSQTILQKQYFEHYSSIVDNSDKQSGVDNYAEAALSANKPNESSSWKSSLTKDNVMKLPCVKNLIQVSKASAIEERGNDGDEIILDIKPTKRQTAPENQPVKLQNKNPQQPATHDATKPLFKPMRSANNDDSRFKYSSKNNPNLARPATSSVFYQQTGPGRSIPDSNRHGFASNQFDSGPSRNRTQGPESSGSYYRETTHNDSWSGTYTGHGNVQNTFKRKANFNGNDGDSYTKQETGSRNVYQGKQTGRSDYDDNNDDFQQPSNAPSLFKTAREQLVINNQKKFGSRRNTPSTSNYGGGKKSLGTTRRGINSKFVPPVLNRDGDEDRSSSGLRHQGNRDEQDEIVDERLKNIDPKMIELITNEIMDHGAPITWDDIAGLEFAKTTIKEIVIWPMLRPDIFTGLRGPPKGLLLFGPPGTGKTLIGKCIASQAGATFFSISASSLTSKWVGEGEKMVRAMFAVARCHQPAVIFIDEIDSLLTQRVDGEHESSRRIKTEFLVQLDGAGTDSGDRILVVGATNRPQEIDEAARRRLVKRLYIPLPEFAARQQIIVNLLTQQSYSLSEEEIMKICENTDGYSGADMANLCREAALGPIRSIQVTDIQHISADQVRPIVYEDFEEALTNVRPSVSQKDLEIYLEWNKMYGSGMK